MEILTKKVLSTDGIHELSGVIYLPDGEIRGLFQVVHGMTEYIRRYDPILTSFCEKGYLVFGYDHLGHGLTAKDSGELGYIAEKDGWTFLRDDVKRFADAVRSEYGENLPYYLMGHSMGSFIVRLAVESGLSPDKLIVMGTGGPNPISALGLSVIKNVKKAKGDRHISKTIDKLAFGSYNKRFEADGPGGWLTKDAEVRKKYAADPFCNFKFTVSAMQDLVILQYKANKDEWFEGFPKNLPTLFVSGSEDPVGDYGKGVKTIFERLRKGGADVRMKLYETYRHEILNDSSRNEVIADLSAFLAE